MAPKAAAIYCRISEDKRGEALGVQRQEELCRKLADEKGWPVAEVYADNDVSAFNGKARAAYRRMVTDLEAGRRDAVICVDLDRLTRRPAELESFIDLADRLRVGLANVAGDTDLSTSDGRLKARILGAVARQESEKKSERVQREAEQAARRGIPRISRRPFGWNDDKLTLRADEAALIRDAVDRVLAGDSFSAIAADWNARGIPTSQKATHGWHPGTIAQILRNPRIAGLRTYKGEIVAEGTWEAIIDRSTFEALQARIRKVSRPGRPPRRLLSGAAKCGRCGGPLWQSWRKDHKGNSVARYVCTKRPGTSGCGGLAVLADPLDDLIRDALIEALAGDALAEARRQVASDDDTQAAAIRELTDAEQRRDDAAQMFAAGDLSRREWLTIRDTLETRIRAAQAVLEASAGPLADLPADEATLRQAWADGSLEWRRALIETVIESITVAPVGRSNRFDPDRIGIVWRV